MENAIRTYDLYRDMKERTKGEIYIGVLGPVRTGKSTFIKRFMEEMVLPNMEDEHLKQRTQDELPQSAGGKTITTTEPKFIPNEAVTIKMNGETSVSVRLIDCVGYMVEGAAGHMEGDFERMVKTPWFEKEIPFTQAAEVGTDKVMNDHSTIGLVITTDGSIGELPRQSFLEAEGKTILALKKLKKPFLVLVNSKKPYSEEAKATAAQIQKQYDVSVLTVNCEQLKQEDIYNLLEQVLYEFPIAAIEFYMPKWVEMLPKDHVIKTDLVEKIKALLKRYHSIKSVLEQPIEIESTYIKRCKTEQVSLSDGVIKVRFEMDESYYYDMLSELMGERVTDEYQLLEKLKSYANQKREYAKVLEAVWMVRQKGYGVVTPDKEEILLEQPELIKHGNKFGVKMKASSPSIHMIRAAIETEIAPIVGTKEQAEDLIRYISHADQGHEIWDTNIFGKTVEQLIQDGIAAKVAVIGEESQLKLQDTMQKIVNESNGGMVCIII